MRKVSLLAAAVAALGLGSAAMGQQIDNQTAAIEVNIEVPAVVSVWLNSFADVDLVVGQSDGTGFAGAARDVSYINNVVASIKVAVTGTLPVVEGGMNFFIFPYEDSVADAKAASQINAYNPPGALVWTQATMGTQQTFAGNLPINNAGGTIPVVYAANMPGGTGAPDTKTLVVTYTIAPGA